MLRIKDIALLYPSANQFKKDVSILKCTSSSTLLQQFQDNAYKNSKEGIFKTYLLYDGDDKIGFLSLSAAAINNIDAKSVLGMDHIGYSIPALKITRLCIFDDYQREGYGQIAIQFAAVMATLQQIETGCRAILVDSKNDAIDFYLQNGFELINTEEDSATALMVMALPLFHELHTILPDLIEFCQHYDLNYYTNIFENLLGTLNS